MARLIDADEYNKKLKDHADKLYANIAKGATCPSLEWFNGLSYAQSVADGMPTVEAITVDWIEDWLDKITGTRDGEDISQLPEQLKFAIQMINLMEMDWRKENESISI